MPSKSVLEQKQAYVADLAEKLKKAAGGVLVDYKGISVEDDTKLRKDLRENGVEYFVVKNTLLKRAAEVAGIEGLEPALSGTTAIALTAEDIIIAPKILFKQTEAPDSTFAIKLGFVDGKVISKEEVEAYAKLPSKDTLLSARIHASVSDPESCYRTQRDRKEERRAVRLIAELPPELSA